MPNHVTTEVEINGTESEIKAVREFMASESNPFDFNSISAIPKELVGTKSPMTIITQKEYDRQELVLEIFDRHKALEGDALVLAMNKDLEIDLTNVEASNVIYFNNHGFSRCLTKKISEEVFAKYGTDNWYEWQCEAWGTKWNSYEHWNMEEGTDFDTFGFQTAWSHPMPIMEALSGQFPNVELKVRFADEDTGYNVGEYSMLNGEIVDNNFPDGGSFEAYELAIDISGSEYEQYDVFGDYEEEESGDGEHNYFNFCIEFAIKHKSFDSELESWVLQMALDSCVANENFEYAKELKILLDKKAK